MRKLVLQESVFLWKEGSRGLLYNTESSSSILVDLSDQRLAKLFLHLLDIDNLYTAPIEEDESQATLSFIKLVEEKGFGKVVPSSSQDFSFPPVLKINHSVENKKFWGSYETQPILPNLMRLVVFLGGLGEGGEWWKQIVYPKTSASLLGAEQFFHFLSRCECRFLGHIDLVISEWNSSQITSFAEGLKDQKGIVRFFFAHPDPGFDNEILNNLAASGYAVTQVCLPDNGIQKAAWTPGRCYQLCVRSEEEVEHWETLLEGREGVDYDFKPVANNNLEFFRENIFLSEEEILSQKLSKKDIFRHQALNVNQFGTFFVFPDGTIHPAADAPAIGTLEDSVHQTIIRELEENHAWRQTRRLMEPCKDCLYHDLCPSPSVYERVFGVPGCTYWE